MLGVQDYESLCPSGLALDLAYILGTRFGEEFERWEDANQSATPSAKVDFHQIIDKSQLGQLDNFKGAIFCEILGVLLWGLCDTWSLD